MQSSFKLNPSRKAPMIVPRKKNTKIKPLMVLAHPDEAFSASARGHFRRLGWEVHLAISGGEARRLAQALNPDVVLLGVDWPGESGWLICDKLNREHPGRRVVLVAGRIEPEMNQFADFVGASGIVGEQDGMQMLVDEVYDAALPAAG